MSHNENVYFSDFGDTEVRLAVKSYRGALEAAGVATTQIENEWTSLKLVIYDDQ